MEKILNKESNKNTEQLEHLVNCENKECNCLIHIDVYNTHKRLYGVGYCGLCIQPYVNPSNPFIFRNKK